MDIWVQNYLPINGSLWLSSLVAVLPIVFFFLALTKLKLKGYVAGGLTMLIALGVAIFAYRMPVAYAVSSALYGFLYGLWPIAWIIITAVFLYKVTVKTGQFDIIRNSIISITPDQRIQVILVAFCFGAFLEGATGFGASVAITAALLVGLGFNPLYAAGLSLIANTAPVAYGAMGLPILVAGQVTGADPFYIGQIVAKQLTVLTIILPFWLVAMMDGIKGIKQTWPVILVSGISYTITQLITSHYIGHELPNITSSLVSLVVTALFLKVWHPKEIFTFNKELSSEKDEKKVALSAKTVLVAWSPFIILTVMVCLWSVPSVKEALSFATIKFDWPYLNQLIAKAAPFAQQENDLIKVVYKVDVLGAVGTSIFLAAVLSILFLRLPLSQAVKTFGETLYELRYPIISIGFVLAFAFIANYSGLSSTLALLLAHTGLAFPFFSPFLGWLGVFLTGSDTSSNALFCSLQANTAHQIGVDSNLLTAVNTTGGVTGKMISPQSIAVACGAVGISGQESSLFKFTVKHSLIFCVMIGIITVLQAYVIT
ncbi:lactate permease LctP family transporter [Basilea psittacipulmonis]|uniref:L-lactate permease n=1 Tax=Basilea psittacipulmonis DSM 24701 TaxID=1072685 RepID=A0A077DGL2_9BURK|nr:lactate permease LctP family transporter [Basilea psittacipulmonis]AIL32617.1 L-lactate permease [Basilea psittacipulmonis DSM 24701]